MAFDSMKVDLTDPKKDIELYDWKEVTSHRSFISNTTMLDPNGLFSEEIFISLIKLNGEALFKGKVNQ